MADTTKKQYLDITGAGILVDNMKGYVDAEIDTLDQAINGVNGSLTAEIANRKAAVTAEENRAKGEEARIEGLVTAEVARAEAKEEELQNAIDAINADTTVADDLADEIARAKAEEERLAGLITAEAETARAAEGANAQAIADEAARADAEEKRIVGLVEAEAARADAAEKANAQAIVDEETRATGVESGLNTRLAKVETFFETAEGETLDTALDTLVELQKYLEGEGELADQMVLDIAANEKAIEDEVLRATNAETALDERLDIVEAAIGEGGNVDSQIDAKIAELDSTAAHTAGADGLALNVAIVDGKLTSISGSIAAETYDTFGAANAAQTAAAEDATTKANTAEANAKAYADEIDANIEAIPLTEIEALFNKTEEPTT